MSAAANSVYFVLPNAGHFNEPQFVGIVPDTRGTTPWVSFPWHWHVGAKQTAVRGRLGAIIVLVCACIGTVVGSMIEKNKE